MVRRPDTITARARGPALACLVALALAILMTWPLATGLGRLGRTSTMDGLYSIWNVAWVARTIAASPADLFDANIFYPHHNALAFSESNIGAGIVGIPAWLITKNPYAAHNTAMLFALATTALGMWLLARRLSGDADAAAVAAVMFAFCPYFFAHTAHIQLLMAGGIPLSLLALHRLADAPSPKGGVVLGATLGAQALSCAYYAIFAGLMVGYGVLFLAISRRIYRVPRYWLSVAIAVAVSGAMVVPFFLPYLEIQRDEGFRRTLDDAMRYSAIVPSYLASGAHAHRWLLDAAFRLGWHRDEVLFPGVIAIVCGAAGLVSGLRGPGLHSGAGNDRETVALYGSLAVLAFWASLGPRALLYTVMFHAIPLFSFLRAPARFGIVLVLVLALLSALALSRWLPAGTRRRRVAAAALVAAVLAELNLLPFPWERALPLSANYALLAKMPRGVLAEFPFYGERVAFPLHAQYMVFSTAHWMPLVNGYSDHIPADFRQAAVVLDSFPSNEAFAVLRQHRVRYVGIHWDMYGPRADEIRGRLAPFAKYLRPLASDPNMTLYEVVGFP